MLPFTENEFKKQLETFIWSFKVGDNILRNFEEAVFLYSLKENFNEQNSADADKRRFLNKHISITLVAIIEAVLHDFVVRLYGATNHFPITISNTKRKEIKEYISRQSISCNGQDFEGKRFKYLRVKNYSLTQLLDFLKRFELLGQESNPIYMSLEKAVHFRNRIHIYNWHNNFERDEKYVFTDKRLSILESLLAYIVDVMQSKYNRPF